MALELTIIDAYSKAVDSITSGRIHGSPPSLAAFLARAGDHHQAHRDVWNAASKRSSHSPQPAADASGAQRAARALNSSSSAVTALGAALDLEALAMHSCTSAARTLSDANLTRTAALVASVEAEHTALLRLLLGRDPIPDGSVYG